MNDLREQIDVALRDTQYRTPCIVLASSSDLRLLPAESMDGIHPVYKGAPIALSGYLDPGERFRITGRLP